LTSVRYFVIHPSGQRYGPANEQLLSQWASEGRLAPNSLLAEETTGRQIVAGQVPGLVFPTGQPGAPSPGYASGPLSGPLSGQGPTIPYTLTGHNPPGPNQIGPPGPMGYGNTGNPYSTPSPYNPYTPVPVEGNEQLNLSYILSGVGLALGAVCCAGQLSFVSILCGLGGLISALVAQSKGAKAGGAIALAVLALAVPIGLMVVGRMLMAGLVGR
jgi:hypothetical protein